MRLSRKKNCNACRAGWYETRPYTQHCDLNFRVTTKDYTGVPLEPCYKPKTNAEWMEARHLRFPR